MAFAMRVNFVDVVCGNSLKNDRVNGKKSGFSFDIRLSYYRGHFLSDIDEFGVKVDGAAYRQEDVYFCIIGKELNSLELGEAYTEFWNILEPAHIKVILPGGLSAGPHKVEVKLMLRVPYLPLPGADHDHAYMPLNSCGEQVLEIREGENING